MPTSQRRKMSRPNLTINRAAAQPVGTILITESDVIVKVAQDAWHGHNEWGPLLMFYTDRDLSKHFKHKKWNLS